MTTDPQTQFSQDLNAVLESIHEVLIEKNRKYGDAALNPNQTFSSCSAIELINVRIDDKLSRIRNRQNDEDEDPELDLLGYLLLKQIAKRRAQQAAPRQTTTVPSERHTTVSSGDITTIQVRVLDRYKLKVSYTQAGDAMYKYWDIETAVQSFRPSDITT